MSPSDYSSTVLAYFKIGFYIYLLKEQSQHSWKTQKTLTQKPHTLAPRGRSRDPVTTKMNN